MPQAVESYLRSLNTSDRVRAAAWDAVYTVKDDAEAERLLRDLPIADDAKATLWDARGGAEPSSTKPSDRYQSVTRENLGAVLADVGRYEQERTRPVREALPMIGGTVGGVVGGIPGAAVGGAAGEAIRQLERRGAGDATPSTPIAAATDIVTEGGIQGGAEGLGRGVTGAATRGARAVYRGFLKPSISKQMAPRAEQIVQTALDEALPITKGGVRTGERLITELRQQVTNILRDAPGEVDLRQIAQRVRAFARRKYYKPGGDMSDYKAALAVADRIDNHPSMMRPGPPVERVRETAILNEAGRPMSVSERVPGPSVPETRATLSQADEAKRALDDAVGDTGFGVKTGAQRTTEKVARSQVRRAMEAKAPTIAPLNARESKLIDATRAIHQAVQRESNRNVMFGVPTIISGGVGGAEYARTGDATSASAKALALRIGMHPAVASRIAITAARLSRELGVSAATAARLAVHVGSEDAANEPEQ